MSSLLVEAVKNPPIRPSLDAFVDHFFLIAGGPAEVARMLFDEFNAAAQGSLIRQRILDTVLRSLKKNDEGGKGLADDLGILSDDDLARVIMNGEARILASLPVQHVPRPVEPAAAPEADVPPRGPAEGPADRPGQADPPGPAPAGPAP